MAPFLFMRIKVNGYEWLIKYTHDPIELSRNDGTVTLGVTDTSLLTVFIYDGLSPYMRSKVLTHELVHVWMFSYGYYLSIREEEFVCSFIDTYGRDIIENADRILSTHTRTVG